MVCTDDRPLLNKNMSGTACIEQTALDNTGLIIIHKALDLYDYFCHSLSNSKVGGENAQLRLPTHSIGKMVTYPSIFSTQ